MLSRKSATIPDVSRRAQSPGETEDLQRGWASNSVQPTSQPSFAASYTEAAKPIKNGTNTKITTIKEI